MRNTALYWSVIEEILGMKRLHCFPRKNNFLSLFGKIRAEHHFPLIWPFWHYLQIISLVIVSERSPCGFQLRCSHWSFRYHSSFEQEIIWKSGNYRVQIHSKHLCDVKKTHRQQSKIIWIMYIVSIVFFRPLKLKNFQSWIFLGFCTNRLAEYLAFFLGLLVAGHNFIVAYLENFYRNSCSRWYPHWISIFTKQMKKKRI